MSSSTTTTPPSSAGESSQAAEAVARQSQTTSRKITLQSSDKESFEVEEAVACQSQTIKHMIEDGFADDGIPLHNVTGSILAKVIEYCKKHVEAPSLPASDVDDESENELKAWDAEFVNVDRVTLIDLILAANYLNIKGLLDLTLDKVVDLIRGKQPEEIREILGIENDFSPEAEAEIRTENQWAFRK